MAESRRMPPCIGCEHRADQHVLQQGECLASGCDCLVYEPLHLHFTVTQRLPILEMQREVFSGYAWTGRIEGIPPEVFRRYDPIRG